MLPGTSGIELARRLKRDELTSVLRGVERAVEAALRQYEFPPDDSEYIVEVPFTFRLE